MHATDRVTATISPGWSAQARAVLDKLNRPLGARQPVTYQRRLVDDYVPNESFLLPRELAETLAQEGRMAGQQPAGTYARKVLEQLLIDLSWSSSRLEGNTYSLLATEELFKSGDPPTDSEGVMLLNHKRAIEFLVDAVPEYGLTDSVIRNLHALLMQDLLADSAGLGAIRTKVVNIADTTYVPSQVPQLLEEMLSQIITKAQLIKNPVEAAFFLWVGIAYLQPFEDGNKRTSRLAANIPLMLYNCAPLAFLDVDPRRIMQRRCWASMNCSTLRSRSSCSLGPIGVRGVQHAGQQLVIAGQVRGRAVARVDAAGDGVERALDRASHRGRRRRSGNRRRTARRCRSA